MTTSRPRPESNRPQHDRIAEDMDLLTHQEAAARFFDEIETLRAEEARHAGTNCADDARLTALRQRIADLEGAIGRALTRRTPTY